MNHLYLFFAKLININLPNANADRSAVTTLLNIAFGILGAISVLIITYSGIMFMLSTGNPEKIAQARNTIIYALVGLVVALSAALIVNFVIGGIT